LSTGETYHNSIVFDLNNNPLICFQDLSNYKARVLKFDGTSWTSVGPTSISSDMAYFPDIELDNNNLPYVVYRDNASGQKASVLKFDGINWNYLGAPGFSNGIANYTSIALDAFNTPYVIYSDFNNSKKTTVQKFDGTSWIYVVPPAFSAGAATYTSIAIDHNNIPFIAFSNGEVFASELNCSVGLNKEFGIVSSSKIYPNPGNGIFKIDLNQKAKVSVTNVLGQNIFNANYEEGIKTIDIQTQPSGIYLISISNEIGIETLRIIKN